MPSTQSKNIFLKIRTRTVDFTIVVVIKLQYLGFAQYRAANNTTIQYIIMFNHTKYFLNLKNIHVLLLYGGSAGIQNIPKPGISPYTEYFDLDYFATIAKTPLKYLEKVSVYHIFNDCTMLCKRDEQPQYFYNFFLSSTGPTIAVVAT